MATAFNSSGWPIVTLPLPVPIPALMAQSIVSQPVAIINTPTRAAFEVNDLVQGIAHDLVNPWTFVVTTPGVYLITVSAQVGTVLGSVLWLWARRNGADVTTSASNISVPAAGAAMLEMQWLIRLGVGDAWEFWFASNNLGTGLVATPAPAWAPGIPSITCTFNWISS